MKQVSRVNTSAFAGFTRVRPGANTSAFMASKPKSSRRATGIAILVSAMLASYCAHSDTWTDSASGYTWTYTVADGAATITGVSPKPSGDLLIPTSLDENNVAAIGNAAFYNCDELRNIIIPDAVTSIGESAFSGCSGLTSIVIPNSVASIGPSAFSRCSGLEELTLPFVGARRGNSGSPDSLFGYIFGTSSYAGGTYTKQYYAQLSYATYYIPSSLKIVDITDETVLGYGAFDSCSGLVSVMVPDSVASIGKRAFYNCQNIVRVTIPDSVKSIGESAYGDCRVLDSVTIGNGVTSVGDWAFEGCASIKSVTIPQYICDRQLSSVFHSAYQSITNVVVSDGVTSIRAFSGCSELRNITIPESVKSIGGGAFSECSSLTRITIPISVTSIGDGAFENCSGLTSVTIPQCVCSRGLSTVFSYSFQSITNVVISDGVTTIGKNAFYNCSELVSVTIPDSVTSIGESAFYGCRKLMSVTIPAGVTVFGSSAFRGCAGLTSVTIPDGVESIGDSVFCGCNGLTSVTIPNSVKSIGPSAFSGCSGLTSLTIPESVTSIGDSSFKNCWELTSVTIPDSVISIGASAFGDCSRLTSVTIPQCVCSYSLGSVFSSSCQSITNVVISDRVTSVGEGAFRGCSGLKSVTIPDSVTSIGEYAFRDCSGLLSVSIPEAVKSIESSSFYGCSGLTTVRIPDSVTRIGSCAFYDCSNLKSVSIPDSVTSVGALAFTGCARIKSVTIPQCVCTNRLSSVFPSSYRTISNVVISDDVSILGDGVFGGCGGLTSVTIPEGVTSIGFGAFSPCSGLTSVSIPNSVVKIGEKAFSECSGLKNVSIPQSVCGDMLSTVFPSAYQSITNVQISDGVTYIGSSAFSGCAGLTRVTIPNNVRNIGSGAFSDCGGLTNVEISNGVSSIGEEAFKNCISMNKLVFCGNAPSIGTDAFSNLNPECQVKVPFGTSGWGVAIPGTWKGFAIDYTIPYVLFYGNGGSVTLTELSTNEGVIDDELPISSRVGYTFTGWFDDVAGGTEIVQGMLLDGSVRAYAHWEANEYTVSLDPNGGQVGESNVCVRYDAKYSGLPTPTRIGYSFDGWLLNGVSVTENTIVETDSDHVLTAAWTANRYSITYNPNGGNVSSGSASVTFDSKYGSLPVPNRTGHTFAGWMVDGEIINADTVVSVAGNHELVAQWWVNQYEVFFDANGGVGSVTNEQDFAMEIVVPVVTREGYTFVGWQPKVDATVPASNVIYIAQWKQNEYKVSLFVGDGEEGSPLVVEHGAKVGDIALPTRGGYVFGGWYDKPKDGMPVDGDALIVSDMSLYAKWSSIYTVIFDANGGEGEMPDQPFVYGEEQALSKVAFTAAERRFAGWTTERDGVVEYDDGEVVSNLTEIANGVVTLYVAWEVWTDDMQVCDDVFGGDGVVSLDDDGNIVVTLTSDVSGTVEIPDNVGAMTIDLNGHNMVGDDGGHGVTALPGPAIRIVKGDGESDATRLAIVDTSEGEKGQIAGGGESAGIEVAEDAATGVKLDVEEGVGVFNGDGSEQELKPKLVGTGKVTVPKSWKTGQKVTWKATADKGSVFARWEGPLVDSLNLTKNERRNPSLAFAVPEGFETNMVTAVFIPIDDDGLYSLGITQTEFELKEAVSDVRVTDDSQSYVTATASGLPTGLKFDAKKMAITGTPTKSGVYWVQIKAKNASGYQWAENVRVAVSGGGTEAKEPKLTRTAYYPLTVICANDGGTVSGTGVYAEGKKVSVKATPAKGYVFAGWHETANSEKGTVNGVDGADYRSASLNVTIPETRYVFALFATKEDDADSLKVAVEDVTTEKDGTIGTIGTDGTRVLDMGACVSSLSLPKLAVSGLPTGLKYDAKTLKLTGKATKPGVYTVTVKATNAAVTKATDASTTTFKITVPNFECAALPMLKPETDAYGVVRSGVIFDDGLVDCTPADGWSVKVAGLPSGLKWDAKVGKIVGVPTAKAGSYTVTFTASKKGEANQVATITLNVEALPTWTVGTFEGSVIASGALGDSTLPCGLVSMTVAANGKISGKVIDADGTWALSAAAFDSVEGPVSNVEELVFHATVIGKSGKMAITNEVEIAAEAVAARPESAPYLRGEVTARSVIAPYQNFEPGVEWCAWQNLWKTEPWKTDAKAFAKAKPVEIVPSVPSVPSVPFASGIITLKFAATGAVTASGKFVTGQDASGRDIVYSATCSSVLIPDGDGVRISPEQSEHCEAMSLEACAPALLDALDFRVFLYFAPKAGKFDGYSDEVPFVWDGVDFSVR